MTHEERDGKALATKVLIPIRMKVWGGRLKKRTQLIHNFQVINLHICKFISSRDDISENMKEIVSRMIGLFWQMS